MFVDEEDIPMVHQDEDYDDYNTPNISRMNETSFMGPDTREEATSTLRFKQKVKRDKLVALYRHLNVTGNLNIRQIQKKKPQFLSFTMVIDGFL